MPSRANKHMAQFTPFSGVRPAEGQAERVSCLPYDVMNREEAELMARGNADSFLHVTRSEIDLPPSVDAYDPSVYETARRNLLGMLKRGVLVQDGSPRYYLYRQLLFGRVQTGVVGCASIDDYQNNVVRKHELTRVEKELDRIRHFDACGAHTEPVFLSYRANGRLRRLTDGWIREHRPLYDFRSGDGVTHIVWDIPDPSAVAEIRSLFAAMPCLYIADGHHRSASAAKVGLRRREALPSWTGDEEFNRFLAVAFPDEDLWIMDYNRLVRDLGGLSAEEFFGRVRERFDVSACAGQAKPREKHSFGMYLDGKWYLLRARAGTFDPDDAISRLDVSILQENLLRPVLGIGDPRTDKRIDFVGGIRGLSELERRASRDMRVAFAMVPPTLDDLFSVADAGRIMPPKSTWFEPKLRSGLFIHRFHEASGGPEIL